MTPTHPVVMSADGASGISSDGQPLRLVAYHLLNDPMPQMHWVPAWILEPCCDRG